MTHTYTETETETDGSRDTRQTFAQELNDIHISGTARRIRVDYSYTHTYIFIYIYIYIYISRKRERKEVIHITNIASDDTQAGYLVEAYQKACIRAVKIIRVISVIRVSRPEW